MRRRPAPCITVALVIALAPMAARPALAQRLTPADSGVSRLLAPDSAAQARAIAAGAALLNWVASTGSSEQTVFLRNTSDQDILVTGYEIYECHNLASRICGEHSSKLRIAPGATARLQRITPRTRQQSWSYRYRFTAAFAPTEADSTAASAE